MDQPTKPQPQLSSPIAMGSSETKGKLKGPALKADPKAGASRTNKAAYEAKLDAQEAAHLASRKKKAVKDDN
jgi:hypothetical protein